MAKKLFVSLPMNGYSVEEIRNEVDSMKKFFDKNIDKDFELIDTIFEDIPPKEVINEGCWYLGRSIKAMSEATVVIFHPNWRTARGCIIEHAICSLYGIPYIYMEFSKIDIPDEHGSGSDSQKKLTFV